VRAQRRANASAMSSVSPYGGWAKAAPQTAFASSTTSAGGAPDVKCTSTAERLWAAGSVAQVAKPSPTPSTRRARPRTAGELPGQVRDEIRAAVSPERAARLERRFALATVAYERDRYPEALAELRQLVRIAPEVASVRELYGLTLYRLGRWRQAERELRAFHDMTGSFDQHPVIADCERALGHDAAVVTIYDELRRAGVDREVLVEGRIVLAGTLADRGDVEAAIALLAPVARPLRHPDTAHLRQWYALGDLYERAGDLPRARQLFARVASFSPDLFDVVERLAALR
jgi:tetratricopeptide (TPR) repeat protein